jgi:hypothetical protein
VRMSASPESEPDFYSMDPVGNIQESSVQTGLTTESSITTASEDRSNYVSPRISPSLSGNGQAREVSALNLSAYPYPSPDLSNLQPASDFLNAQMDQMGSGEPTSSFPVITSRADDTKLGELEYESDLAFPEPLNLLRKKGQNDNVRSLLLLSRNAAPYTQLWPEASFSDLGAFLLDVDLGNELEWADEILRSTWA